LLIILLVVVIVIGLLIVFVVDDTRCYVVLRCICRWWDYCLDYRSTGRLWTRHDLSQ